MRSKKRRCHQCASTKRLRKSRSKDEFLCKKCRLAKPVLRDPYTSEQESRKDYERNRSDSRATLILPDWETMRDRFNGCETLEDIASEAGGTRERIRQIFRVYFSKIIPRRPDGKTRRLICNRKKRILSLTDSFLSDPILASLLKRVSELNIEARPIQRSSPGFQGMHIRQHCLLNGKRCRLLITQALGKYTKRGTWACYVRYSRRFDFQIVQIQSPDGPRFLVIPSDVIGDIEVIYVPANFKRVDYNGSSERLKVDWLQYLEAWHLLQPTAAESAAKQEPPNPTA